MRIRSLITLAVFAAMLAPLPGRAAPPTTRNIDMRTAEYVAKAVAASPGDIISWTAISGGGQGQGGHEVRAYSGATFASSDASNAQADADGVCPSYPCGGNPNGMVPYEKFAINYSGGTILYRCTLSFIDRADPNGPKQVFYSRIDPDTGQCFGMCGKITDTPPANLPGVPTISASPQPSSTVVNFTGTAPNAGAVLLRQHIGTAVKELIVASVDGAGNWAWPWDFQANGTYKVDVVGIHAEGYRSAPSAPVLVTVASADRFPPTIRLDRPINGPLSPLVPNVQTGRLDIAGRVFDDVGVASVSVVVQQMLPPDLLGPGVEYRPVVTYTSGVTETAFNASVNVFTGQYLVIVTALDVVGRKNTDPRPDGSIPQPTTRQVIVAF